MSLFLGNISRNVDAKTLEKAFKEYGSCKVDLRVIKYNSPIINNDNLSKIFYIKSQETII
jgi:hypothetical protein